MKHLSPLFLALFILLFAATSIGCSDDEPSDSNNQTDTGLLQDVDEDTSNPNQADAHTPSDTEDPDIQEPSDTDPSDTEESDTDPSDTDPSDTEESDTEESDTDPSDTDPSDTEESDTQEPTEFACPPNHHLVDNAPQCTDAGNTIDHERGCLTVESQEPTAFCAADHTIDCTRTTVDSCPEGYSETDKATCESSDKSCGFYLLCDFMAWCLEN